VKVNNESSSNIINTIQCDSDPLEPDFETECLPHTAFAAHSLTPARGASHVTTQVT